MRTLIIVVALLAFVIGLGFFFLGDTPEVEAPSATSETATTSSPEEKEASDDNTEETNVEVEGGTDVGAEFPRIEGDVSGEVPYAALVTYTDDGFTPKTVTIEAEETVRFVNESSRDMWVGSDNHPTHTLYPHSSADDCLGSSFDQCESTVRGTYYEYTFTETGEWGYHNHVRASHGGTIIVE